MQITCFTIGSYGDIRPIIALGLGLKKAGHTVKIAARSDINFGREDVDYEPLVTQCGLEFIALKNEYLTNDFLEELWNPCQSSDAVIFSQDMFPCGYIAAEKLKIPCFMVWVHPGAPTFDFPDHKALDIPFVEGLYNSQSRWLSSPVNRLSYYFYFSSQIRELNNWRQESLQLPPLPCWSNIESWTSQKQIPCFYIHSPALLPKPLDWPYWTHVTGYCFLNTPSDWRPPQDLVDFLAKGNPPVYIGFGLFNPDSYSEEIITFQLEALKRSQQRGILLITKDLKNRIDLPDEVFPLEWVCFDWLFPKLAAVVHHGGLGTIHAALKAGIPNVIVPHDTDTLFWGHQLAKLGLGLPPIREKQFSLEKVPVIMEKVVAAIKAVTSDKAIHTRLTKISKQIQAEDGVQRAVEIFHSYL